MRKILIAISILFSTMLVGCGVKEVDISKYINVEEVGFNSLGHISAYVSDKFYLDKNIFGDIPVNTSKSYYENPAYDINLKIEPNKNLKNNDVIQITPIYDEKLFENEFKVKLVNNHKYTVNKLEKTFLNKDDLSSDNYKKLKKVSEDKVKNYIESESSPGIDFTNFEFLGTFIKNPYNPKTFKSDSPYPNIGYLYKVDVMQSFDDINLKLDPIKDTRYFLIEINKMTFESKGNLKDYSMSEAVDSMLVLDSPLDLNQVLDKFKAKPFIFGEVTDTFEKIDLNN